ncbi:hypothetical protein BKA82DRAFT_997190 [Pisolithus tinctorius]|uniref:Uncharacterized protein n=1 Tax=Pisolithus tinctorius Marx 270 TaxID=870435 RepID=A0A0C3KFA3_PISTI|nr:hypothetical protein BKA82DRAFT_997190 [Pisolithus tinctorius]KIO08262.1 hypothetical protein M404DRAFT_997190 [Pisolithus tinctorius Marx 270]
MGSLCSKRNTHSGSQQILGGSTTATGRQDYGSSADARAAAAAAAERRLKSGQARRIHAANPKGSRPATQQEASKGTRMPTSNREEEPLVWD